MKKSKLAIALAARLEELRWKPIQIQHKSERLGKKISRQYISKILNATPHNITGKPPNVSPAVVEIIADTVGWDIDYARQIAGYAPKNVSENQISDALMESVYSKYKKATLQKREELRKILEMINTDLNEEK